MLQDYIKNFFGPLHACEDLNENPSAPQLEIAMKYLLIHKEIRSSETSNYEWVNLEDINAFATGHRIISDEPLPVAVRRIEIDSDYLLDKKITADDYTETLKLRNASSTL